MSWEKGRREEEEQERLSDASNDERGTSKQQTTKSELLVSLRVGVRILLTQKNEAHKAKNIFFLRYDAQKNTISEDDD